MNESTNYRRHERGGAGVKLLLVGLAIFLVGFAAYNYIPTAYEAQNFKQDMDGAMLQASAAITGISPVDNLKSKLLKAAANNNLPANSYIEVKENNGKLQARVYYVKNISLLPFGLFNYKYQFDYTASPAGFLFK